MILGLIRAYLYNDFKQGQEIDSVDIFTPILSMWMASAIIVQVAKGVGRGQFSPLFSPHESLSVHSLILSVHLLDQYYMKVCVVVGIYQFINSSVAYNIIITSYLTHDRFCFFVISRCTRQIRLL